MKTLKIEIPEGFKIGGLNTKTGVISFIPEKPKYPTSIRELGVENTSYIQSDSSICDTYRSSANYTSVSNNDLNLSDTREEAEAFLALMQLKRLCNAWNKIDNFVPDFTKWNDKYAINCRSGKIIVNVWTSTSFPLAFKNRGTALLFMKKFEDLLETAKPLL